MIREHRYIVIKRKDLHNALTRDERGILNDLCGKVNDYRLRLGKKPLECVVVESDWPEYEPTWQAIEERVDGAKAGTNEALADAGGTDYMDTGRRPTNPIPYDPER